MPKAKTVRACTVTLIDVQLAGVYYPILVSFANQKRTITYGQLIEEAKQKFPNLGYVQGALAVSTGRRLDVVRQFTNEKSLPDVTSLVINQAKGECGRGFTDAFNPQVARREVFEFDWTEVSLDFEVFLEVAVKNATPLKKRTAVEARKLVWEYYKLQKSELPAWIKGERDNIISVLMSGVTVEEAFAIACGEAVEAAPLLAA